MGILHGPMNLMRFRVSEPDAIRSEQLFERLHESRFKTARIKDYEAHLGWTQVQNLGEPTFEDLNTWNFENDLVFALRIDQIKLPGGPFKAEVDRQVKAWCDEHEINRAPRELREEIKENIKNAWVLTLLPHSKLIELRWSKATGAVYLQSSSTTCVDQVKIQFFRTLGLRLVPVSPFEWIDEDEAHLLQQAVPSSFGNASYEPRESDL